MRLHKVNRRFASNERGLEMRKQEISLGFHGEALIHDIGSENTSDIFYEQYEAASLGWGWIVAPLEATCA